jgi:hypothetical protein
MNTALSRLVSLAACLACGLGVACSGAPPEDGGPDYELDPKKQAPVPSTAGTNPDAGKTSSTEETKTPTTSGPAENAGSDAGTTTASTVAVTIDGTTVTVDGTNLWNESSGPGKYSLFIKVAGPGIPAGSDIIVSAMGPRVGCSLNVNDTAYRVTGEGGYVSNQKDTCGLTVESIPTAVGGRFKGSFKGTLSTINTSTPKSKSLEFTFDVLREK